MSVGAQCMQNRVSNVRVWLIKDASMCYQEDITDAAKKATQSVRLGMTLQKYTCFFWEF